MRRALTGKLIFPLLFMTQSMLFCVAQTQNGRSTQIAQIAGVWRGHSECMVKDSPCHDEVNVYRFSQIEGKAATFSCAGSKIVDGKEIQMGVAEWRYHAENHTLEAEDSGASFHLIVKENQMEGTLTLPDHTVYRRIYLQKEN